MAEPLISLHHCCRDRWLIGVDQEDWQHWMNRRRAELQSYRNSGKYPTVLLAEPDPARFLAGFLAASAAACPVFLGNPQWSTAEWQQAIALANPDLIWGRCPVAAPAVSRQFEQPQPGWIMIPTGGSSGQIRFAIHTWATLTASVQGFQQYFQLNQVNSCCVLPLYHVSGLMQVMRSFLSGGKFAVFPFKALESASAWAIAPDDFVLSLVPTQLHRLCQNPSLIAGLQQFQAVFLGGAPPWPSLLATARRYHLPLALTYGMTETAAQVATLKPKAFLQGHESCGQALPHAKITVQDADGHSLGPHQVGKVTLQAKSLALGYFPELFQENFFQPDDVGFLDEQGELHLVGRSSHKIITGGEKVFPEEVEAAMLETGRVADVCVVGVSDRHWGEIVTAVYVPTDSDKTAPDLSLALKAKLSPFKCPKVWLPVSHLPRNAQGKVNRRQIQQMAIAQMATDATGATTAP